jgi:hypothetical protein
MTDRADIYAAMEADEDAASDEARLNKPLVNPAHFNLTGGQSVPFPIGDKTIDVATLAYVRRLERIVQTQDIAIKKMERMFRALEQSLRQTRTVANNGQARLAEVARDLDQKIDRRD